MECLQLFQFPANHPWQIKVDYHGGTEVNGREYPRSGHAITAGFLGWTLDAFDCRHR
ncbi:MAG TPA: hypothetical protein VK129_06080 [Terriglobales bacterium]|nr:hypothetical protein [Terriglobales bacterium]